MKAVILAGGLGTRLAEETVLRPKPMVEIGGMPILWHIMKIYYAHGVTEFIICLGYKGHVIKEYFEKYFLHTSDVVIDFANDTTAHINKRNENWKVSLIDTGQETMTGGRLKRVADYLDNEPFCMTYGDGVGNVPIRELIAYHKSHQKLATLTAAAPPARFGALDIAPDGTVKSFVEKPVGDGALINAGFFVLDPKVIDYVSDDTISWERQPLERLAADNQLSAFKHNGFWQPMDTLRDKQMLEALWAKGKAPWKIWE
ncbi:MAG: glucose-1-phosphate cytidylyltransferase [Pseudomonadota bacterium]